MKSEFRLLAHEHRDKVFLELHRVYYSDQGGIEEYSRNPIQVWGESRLDFSRYLASVQKALNKPTLWSGSRFPQEYDELNYVFSKLLKCVGLKDVTGVNPPK